MSREYNGPNDLSLLVMIGLGLVIVIPGVIFIVADGGIFLVAAVVGAVLAILLVFRYLNRPRRRRDQINQPPVAPAQHPETD